ncbi:MAG: hypothetical protein WEH44_03350, partial [Pirellulaceae bacterium]
MRRRPAGQTRPPRDVRRVFPGASGHMLSQLSHLAVYFLVRSILSLVQAVSIETYAACADVLAVVLYDVLRIRRKIVDDNLAIALERTPLPERRRIARQMWRHLLLMIAE